MDPVSLLIGLLVFGVIVWLAFWIIGQAFPAPVQQPARLIVGVVALLALLLWAFGRGPVLISWHR